MILFIGNILCRIMNSEDTVLVEFFAPWCPACVTFLPELEKLQEENWDIPMYKVGVGTSASKSSIQRFVITEKAPTRAFSWLKAATTAFTFKTILRQGKGR